MAESSRPQAPPPDTAAAPPGVAGLSPARLWSFRLLALFLAPVLLFLLLESGLRLAGHHDSTAFLVPSPDGGMETNPRFGWRFFPPHLARTPVPQQLPLAKADGEFRVLLLGGSAAMGTPEPAFGPARHLEAQLRALYPQRPITVVNGAMAAINSHVLVDIARDAMALQPDLVIVYAGNNEVVGPFGAGTVFGSLPSSRLALRARLLFTRSALGQFLSGDQAGTRASGASPTVPQRWGGMEMFLRQRLGRDHPRLHTVARHYRANLRAIVEEAQSHGAAVLLCTVASNLRQSPPFAAVEGAPVAVVDRLLSEGAVLLAEGNPEQALARYDEALQRYENHAALHFRRGQALYELGRDDEARASFLQARDLDTLRFRADSRLNAVVQSLSAELGARRATPGDDATASHSGSNSLFFLDAELALSEADPAGRGLPGEAFFYEHVHFNFAGNFHLARAMLQASEPALEQGLGPPRWDRQLGLEDVARELAFTAADSARMARTMIRLMSKPPFSNQIDHSRRSLRSRQELVALGKDLGREQAGLAAKAHRERLRRRPDDLLSSVQLAEHLETARQTKQAAEQWQLLVERLPRQVDWLGRLALLRAELGEADPTRQLLARLDELQPPSAIASNHRGLVLQSLGDIAAAEQAYSEALRRAPGSPQVLVNLANLRVQQGELERAIDHYRAALALEPEDPWTHADLATALQRTGEATAAIRHYRDALRLLPGNASFYNGLGLALESAGRPLDAERSYRHALKLNADLDRAHFNLADLLLSSGRPEGAAEHYRLGLAASEAERRHSFEPRYRLALALAAAGRSDQALAALQALSQEQPEHAGTLDNLAWLMMDRGRTEDLSTALDLAQRAVQLSESSNAGALETLARAHSLHGQPEAEAKALRGALALLPGDSPKAEGLRLRLKVLQDTTAATP